MIQHINEKKDPKPKASSGYNTIKAMLTWQLKYTQEKEKKITTLKFSSTISETHCYPNKLGKMLGKPLDRRFYDTSTKL